MNRLLRHAAFFAPAAVMSAWATVMLHTFATGHLNRLLSPVFRSYVLVAAAVLLLLSVLYFWLYQPEPETASEPAFTSRFRQLGRWLVLLAPVLAAAVLSPAALSGTTLANRSTSSSTAGVPSMASFSNTDENVRQAIAADAHEPVPVEITDLITLSHSPQQVAAFEGRKVRTVGLMPATTGGEPKLIRWIMWCCAADAQPVAVALTGNTAGKWKDTDWLEITGTAHFPSTLGQVIPQIEVDTIKPAQEPDEPFLSP